MSYSFLTSPENDSVLKEVLALKDAGHTGEVTIFTAQGSGDEGCVEIKLIDEESSLYEILSECLEDGWEVHGAGSSGHFKVDFDNEVICTSFYYWQGTGDYFFYASEAKIHEYDFDGELISDHDVSGECPLLDEISNGLDKSNILSETQAFINGLSWDNSSSIETIYALANKVYDHLIALMEHVINCLSEFNYVEIEDDDERDTFYDDLLPELLADYERTCNSLVNLLSDLLLIIINENQRTKLEDGDSLLNLLNKIESLNDNSIWHTRWDGVAEKLLGNWFEIIDKNIENWKKNIVS
jgi:hypothetical protein